MKQGVLMITILALVALVEVARHQEVVEKKSSIPKKGESESLLEVRNARITVLDMHFLVSQKQRKNGVKLGSDLRDSKGSRGDEATP